jgi:hypothetical protein
MNMKRYIKPSIETIVIFNQPMLAGHSNAIVDSKGNLSFPDEFDKEEDNTSNDKSTTWK